MFQNNTKDAVMEIPEYEISTKYSNPNQKEKEKLRREIVFF
jgi:hypothetical protein